MRLFDEVVQLARATMTSTAVLLSQAFNSLALGSLLALVFSGLTIILGTLGG